MAFVGGGGGRRGGRGTPGNTTGQGYSPTVIGATGRTASFTATPSVPGVRGGKPAAAGPPPVPPAPTVTDIAPPNGPVAGGNTVVITGTNFSHAIGVAVDGSVTDFTIDSDTQITIAPMPPAKSGAKTVGVEVHTMGGYDAGTYTYE